MWFKALIEAITILPSLVYISVPSFVFHTNFMYTIFSALFFGRPAFGIKYTCIIVRVRIRNCQWHKFELNSVHCSQFFFFSLLSLSLQSPLAKSMAPCCLIPLSWVKRSTHFRKLIKTLWLFICGITWNRMNSCNTMYFIQLACAHSISCNEMLDKNSFIVIVLLWTSLNSLLSWGE